MIETKLERDREMEKHTYAQCTDQFLKPNINSLSL